MRLLILGGSGFLGRHVAADAVARGWAVTTFNRGTAPAPAGVTALCGDRLRPADLEPLAAARWDAVVDTWSGAPVAVRDSARALAAVADRYLYVSSCSVYTGEHPGRAEAAPTVEADPAATGAGYAAAKRGAELAVEAAFGGRCLLARAGLVLGPGEDVGRLPYWLGRVRRGGPLLAPGPPGLGLQWIDARDLAAFLDDQAGPGGATGPVDVVGDRDAASFADLLAACARATGAALDARWATPAQLAAAGVEPWTELPAYLPPDHEARWLLERDTARARAAGLRTRPLEATVADTWAWLRAAGAAPQRPDRPVPGLDPEQEARALLHFAY